MPYSARGHAIRCSHNTAKRDACDFISLILTTTYQHSMISGNDHSHHDSYNCKAFQAVTSRLISMSVSFFEGAQDFNVIGGQFIEVLHDFNAFKWSMLLTLGLS